MNRINRYIRGLQRRRDIQGYLIAIASAFAYGALTLIAKQIVTHHAPPIVSSAFSFLIGTFLVAFIFHKHILEDITNKIPVRGWIFLLFAGLSSTWGVTFWILGVSEAPVVVVGSLVGIYPLVSIALTHFFLRRMEVVTWRTLMGTMLMVLGVILVTVGRNA
jgi:drug/metabolite transporter (DMT)-like permease